MFVTATIASDQAANYLENLARVNSNRKLPRCEDPNIPNITPSSRIIRITAEGLNVLYLFYLFLF
jgi:hypothetical protein